MHKLIHIATYTLCYESGCVSGDLGHLSRLHLSATGMDKMRPPCKS